MKVFISIMAGFLLLVSSSFSFDQENPVSYGAFVNYNYNMHNSDFPATYYYSIPAPQFKSGHGSGTTIGLALEVPLTAGLSAILRPNFMIQNGVLKVSEPGLLKDINGELIKIEYEHSIDATINTYGAELLLGYRAFRGFKFMVGASISAIVKKDTIQKITIISSNNTVKYTNTNSEEWVHGSGEIGNSNAVNLGLVGGLQYEIYPFESRAIVLRPELLFDLGLTNYSKDLDWKSNSIRIGMSVAFNIGE